MLKANEEGIRLSSESPVCMPRRLLASSTSSYQQGDECTKSEDALSLIKTACRYEFICVFGEQNERITNGIKP